MLKTLVVQFLLGFCIISTARAQEQTSYPEIASNPEIIRTTDSSTLWTWNKPGTTRLERISYVTGASLVYALLDYYGFNLVVRKWHNNNAPLQICKSLAQIAISYFLDQQLGLSSAVSFNLIWWTWGDDIAYYGWSYIANSFPWEDRTENGFRFPDYTWAGWTPVGLLRPQGRPIARSTLIGQATVGLSVSIALLW